MNQKMLQDLNHEQADAVTSINGPVLLIAGPGSGKTRVITHRIAHLVKSQKVNPYRITAMTFTNKAARELKDRLATILDNTMPEIAAGTFHSFCAKFLRIEGQRINLSSEFVIYDDGDQIEQTKVAMEELQIDQKQFPPRSILSSISNAKSQLIPSSEYKSNANDYFQEVVGRVYEQYERFMSLNSALDFDDLLIKTHFILSEDKEISEKYSERFLHVMVDEFQDTNVAQYEIAKLLVAKHRNFCAVGDPDQSIYSWRNADIRNILSFQTDFPDAKVIPLVQNYRSSSTILEAAQHLISANDQRVEKDLWTSNKPGELITIEEAFTDIEEAESVLNHIKSLTTTQRYSNSDIAIMYRVNSQSRLLEESCRRHGVPYQLIGGQKFYQRQEIKDLVSYLRTIANPYDDISLMRIINTPPRGIGKKTFDDISLVARDEQLPLFFAIGKMLELQKSNGIELNTRSIKALSNFYDTISKLSEILNSDTHQSLGDLINSILDLTNYRQILQSSKDIRDKERLENLDEFLNSASDYQGNSLRESLSEFLETISLISDIDKMEDESSAITLITLHQSKGLEFPVVFIIGMEEGLLPHIRSMEDPEQIEEERRLCYVGLTRAKEKLFLMRAFRRGYKGLGLPTLPSRFLNDLPTKLIHTPKNLPKYFNKQKTNNLTKNKAISSEVKASGSGFMTGDKVNHPEFGAGIVMNCKQIRSDFEITVAFKEGAGIKRLIASAANLKKI